MVIAASWFLQQMLKIFQKHVSTDCDEHHIELSKLVQHCDIPDQVSTHEMDKIWGFKPELKKVGILIQLQRFILEKFVDSIT